MADYIRIQMMGSFGIMVNGKAVDQTLRRSLKGCALIQLLLLEHGQAISKEDLRKTLWDSEKSSNPENALKTLVSRTREIMDGMSDQFGRRIVSKLRYYYWDVSGECFVDLFRIEEILKRLLNEQLPDEEADVLCCELIELYQGDLLAHDDTGSWLQSRRVELIREQFLASVYAYIGRLKSRGNHVRVMQVCRQVLSAVGNDDRLYIEMMNSLMRTNQERDDIFQNQMPGQSADGNDPDEPGKKIYYRQLLHNEKTMEDHMESVCSELKIANEQNGSLVCEYDTFMAMVNMMTRNFERTRINTLLAVVMLTPSGASVGDSVQAQAMEELLSSIRFNLRKGDAISYLSATTFGLLMPIITPTAGNLVLERLKKQYEKAFPESGFVFSYRVVLLND